MIHEYPEMKTMIHEYPEIKLSAAKYKCVYITMNMDK